MLLKIYFQLPETNGPLVPNLYQPQKYVQLKKYVWFLYKGISIDANSLPLWKGLPSPNPLFCCNVGGENNEPFPVNVFSSCNIGVYLHWAACTGFSYYGNTDPLNGRSQEKKKTESFRQRPEAKTWQKKILQGGTKKRKPKLPKFWTYCKRVASLPGRNLYLYQAG